MVSESNNSTNNKEHLRTNHDTTVAELATRAVGHSIAETHPTEHEANHTYDQNFKRIKKQRGESSLEN